MKAAELLQAAEGWLVDLDGTLVDSDAPVHRAWSAFARRHGLDPEEVIRFAQGRPSGETVRLLAPASAHAAEAARLEHDEVHHTDGVRALPGAMQLLTRPRQRIAIVTSCSRALARARLAAAGLPEPATMVTSDDVARGKPDPEPFLLGARRLNLSPGVCVVLEDAPAGISAARAAGATVIAVRTTHDYDALRDAHAVVGDLAELLATG